MKKIITAIIIAMPLAAFAQNAPALSTATVKGSLKNISGIKKLYYSFRIADSSVYDSASIVNNQYTIPVKAEMPVMLTLSTNPRDVRSSKKDMAMVYLQSGINTLSSVDSFSNISVKESKAHAEYIKLKDAATVYEKQIQELVAPYGSLREKNDTVAMRKIEEGYEALQNKMNEEVYGTYIKNNPASPVVLYALRQYAGFDIDPVKVEPLFNAIDNATKQSTAGQRFAERLNIAKATAVGAMAPQFSQADTSGNMVSLASFKGKYVLVDFWASWCGPCRRENPNVVAAFNQYKDKNFTVLGISLDDEDGREKWLAAIAKDQLTWTQLSDLKGWANDVAKQYGIQAIPQNLLLDPTGKIIAKNIRGEELQKKLKEVIQ